MRRLFFLALGLALVLDVRAQLIKSPWTSTTNPATARQGLGVNGVLTLNVRDFGAAPGEAVPVSESYDHSALTPQDTAILAAISAAANSGAASNVVYFPPGIYKITNTVINVPQRVHIIGAGRPYSAGYSSPEGVGGYSMLWFSDTNSVGLAFNKLSKGQGSIRQIAISGYKDNPIPGWVKLATNSITGYAHVGLQAGDADTSWCGGFYAEKISVTGFKLGIRIDAGQSQLFDCSVQGNGIGIGSLSRSDVGPLTNALINAGEYALWTNILKYVPPMGSWGNVYPDDLRITHSHGGRRKGGLVYFFGSGRQISIEHDTSYDYSRLLMTLSTLVAVRDTFNEVSTGESHGITGELGLWGDTNLCVSLGQDRWVFDNCYFAYNGQSGSMTNSFGSVMTNFALVRAMDYMGGAMLEFRSTSCNVGHTYGGQGVETLVEKYSSGGQISTVNSPGLVRLPWGNPVWMARLPDTGTTDWSGQTVWPWNILQTTNLATYSQASWGQPVLRYGRPDHLTFWGRTNSIYSGSAIGPQAGSAQFRLLQSDPYVQGGPLKLDSFAGGGYGKSIRENYTVDQLTIRSNLVAEYDLAWEPFQAGAGYSLSFVPGSSFNSLVAPSISSGFNSIVMWRIATERFAASNVVTLTFAKSVSGSYTFNVDFVVWTNGSLSRVISSVSTSAASIVDTNTATVSVTNIFPQSVVTARPYYGFISVHNNSSSGATWYPRVTVRPL